MVAHPRTSILPRKTRTVVPVVDPVVDPTTAWASDIVSGEIVAGEFMRLACERHLRDIVDGPKRGVYWRPDKAEHALGFFPAMLSVTAGAKEGEPFNLPSYTTFVVGSLFGWHRSSGLLRYRTAWLELGKGQIKALAVDTPIATPSGWTTMGELKTGDKLFDENGQVCEVAQAHEVHQNADCREVRFDDGTKITADAGHLWKTYARFPTTERSGFGGGVPSRRAVEPRVGLRTTAEIGSSLFHGADGRALTNHSVSLAGPLNLPHEDLPTDPYSYGRELGRDNNNDATGVGSNEGIPLRYLRASAAQRLALLQGLMDVGGRTGSDGWREFVAGSAKLAGDVRDLVLTLGTKAATGVRRPVPRSVDARTRYVVTFRESAEPPARRRTSSARQIVGCERVEPVPVRCITVTSASGMFLAGRSLVPTHNSPLMAALGIYIMGFCGVKRSECFAIAKDRKQANVLFQDAVKMCEALIPNMDGETLVSRGEVIVRGTGEISYMLEHPKSDSKFVALAGDEKVNGPRPSYIAADEIHEWKSDGPIQTWTAAMVKNSGNALMVLGTNTPAVDQPVGTEYSEKHQSILRREYEDDTAFAVIARTDPDDNPMEDESCWLKSLPVLGLTFPFDNVRNAVVSAKHSMTNTLAVKRLYFGVPVGVAEYWIDLDAWESVQGRVDPEDFLGARGWLALDLSRKNDLTALGLGFDGNGEDDKLHATVRYWKPEEKLSEAAKVDHGQYVEWSQSRDGQPPFLNTTPGRTIEYKFVAEEVRTLCNNHRIEFMVVDPSYLSDFRKACEDINFDTWIWTPDNEYGTGLKIIIHGQGVRGMNSDKMLWMPRSLGQLEDAILNDDIVIDENPLTKWCFANAAVKPDAQGNRYFVKKRQRGRIDGATVMAMLAGARKAQLGDEVSSIYDDPAAYRKMYGGNAAAGKTGPVRRDANESTWDPAILADMRHPNFAEHKRRFENWQDAQGDDD